MVDERGRRRKRLRQIDLITTLPLLPAQPDEARSRILDQRRQFSGLPQMIDERRLQQLRGGGRHRAHRIGLGRRRVISSQIHQSRKKIRRCDAVGQRVVNLADQCEPVVGHSLGEVELPQRTSPIQGGRAGDLTDHGVQLAAPPGAGTVTRRK